LAPTIPGGNAGAPLPLARKTLGSIMLIAELFGGLDGLGAPFFKVAEFAEQYFLVFFHGGWYHKI